MCAINYSSNCRNKNKVLNFFTEGKRCDVGYSISKWDFYDSYGILTANNIHNFSELSTFVHKLTVGLDAKSFKKKLTDK